MAISRSPARAVLDEVRELLQLPAVTDRTCGVCGGELFGKDSCELCGGKPVRAMNVIKSLREVVSPGKSCSIEVGRKD